jgi:hypothetical protein
MSLATLSKDEYALLLRAARKISDDDERGQFFHYVDSDERSRGLARCVPRRPSIVWQPSAMSGLQLNHSEGVGQSSASDCKVVHGLAPLPFRGIKFRGLP